MQWEGDWFTSFGAVSVQPSQPTTGLPNWTINLENSSGKVIASTTTDAQGNYGFTNVAAGTYTVAEVPQTGWTQFAPASGTYTITVTSDEVISGLNFGNSENTPAPTDPGPVFQSSYGNDPTAQVGQLYTYTAFATDADHDQITYSLGLCAARHDHRPRSLGVIDWTPTADRSRLPERRHRGQRRQRQYRHPVLYDRRLTGRLAAGDHDHGLAAPATPTTRIRTRSPPSRPIIIPVTFSLAAGDPSGMTISAAGLLDLASARAGHLSAGSRSTPPTARTAWAPRPFTLQSCPTPDGGTLTVHVRAPARRSCSGRTTSTKPSPPTPPTTRSPTAWPSPAPLRHDASSPPPASSPGRPRRSARHQHGDHHRLRRIRRLDPDLPPCPSSPRNPTSPPRSPRTPPQYAIVGDLYRYNLTPPTLGNSPWSGRSNAGPAGMVLDPNTNTLIWTPTPDQAGDADGDRRCARRPGRDRANRRTRSTSWRPTCRR